MRRLGLLIVGLLVVSGAPSSAQQLQPRAYTPIPVGMNFTGVTYTYQTGSVLTDPSLPVLNVDAKVDTVTPIYERSFDFLGRSASAALAVPWVWLKATGQVFEQAESVSRSGPGDMQLRLMSNIFGGPALTPREIARAPQRTTLGTTLSVSIPTGQYDGTKLVNIGTHRWAFKPELGLSHPWGPWTFDGYAGAWFFTPNDDFFGGSRRTQAPLVSLQGHVGYDFRPGLWAALDGTWYSGGQTSVNGRLDSDRQANSRIGATICVPLWHGHSLKAAWSRGATVRIGEDFTLVGVTYQYVWF